MGRHVAKFGVVAAGAILATGACVYQPAPPTPVSPGVPSRDGSAACHTLWWRPDCEPLRGVIAMIEGGRDCADVVTQLAAVSRALDRAGFKIIASVLQQCVTAQANGDDRTVDMEQMERLFVSLA